MAIRWVAIIYELERWVEYDPGKIDVYEYVESVAEKKGSHVKLKASTGNVKLRANA